MGSVPSASGEGLGTDEIGPDDSALQIGGAILGTMSVIGGVAPKHYHHHLLPRLRGALVWYALVLDSHLRV